MYAIGAGVFILTLLALGLAFKQPIINLRNVIGLVRSSLGFSGNAGLRLQNSSAGRDLTVQYLNVHVYSQDRVRSVIGQLPEVLRCGADANPKLRASLTRLARDFERADRLQINSMADVERKLRAELPPEAASRILEEADSEMREGATRSLPAVLPYLCDREPQSDSLSLAFHEESVNWRRPVVLIVHGGKDELVTAFVERLKYHSLSLELGEINDPVNWARFDWPRLTRYKTDAVPFELFGPSLRGVSNCRLCLNLDQFSNAFIRDGINLIYSDVETGGWADKGQQAFTHCLQLWSQFPNLHSTSKLIICLTLEYPTSVSPTEPNPIEHQILTTLTTLNFADYPKLQFVILPALESVLRKEVDKWVDETRVRTELKTEDRRLKLKTAVNAMYQDCDRIAMVRLLPKLDSIIEKLV